MPSTINADNGVSSGSAGLKSAADSSGVLSLQTNGTTAVTVDTSQNVGVGTTAPLSTTANRTYLSVKGRGTTTSDGAGVLQFQTNSAGTTSPTVGNIEWDLPDNTGSSSFRVAYISGGIDGTYGSTANNRGAFIVFGTKDDNVSGSGTERMRIDSSGNVGIGTTSPNKRLSVISGGSTQFTIATAAGANDSILFDTYNASAIKGIYTWSQQGTEVMRIDSSGNLLVGATSSTARVFTSGAASNSLSSLGTLDAATIAINNATSDAFNRISKTLYQVGGFNLASVSGVYTNFNGAGDIGGALVFGTQTNAAGGVVERARIDSSGNLLVGTTSNTSTIGTAIRYGYDASSAIAIGKNNAAGNNNYIEFFYGGLSRGYISWNGSGGINYFSSSDYRLKENIAPMTGALDKVAALRPVTYNWKETGKASEGFIAHELQEVFPDAVSYTKDAVDENGKPKYQGIDTSFLVATLTAAIQELKAEVDSLKSQLAAKG